MDDEPVESMKEEREGERLKVREQVFWLDLKCESNQKDDDDSAPSDTNPPSPSIFLCPFSLQLIHVNYIPSSSSSESNQRTSRDAIVSKKRQILG